MLSNITQKLLWFEITNMSIAVLSFTIIFGTLSFPAALCQSSSQPAVAVCHV